MNLTKWRHLFLEQFNKFGTLTLLLSLIAVSSGAGVMAEERIVQAVDAEAQERVTEIIQSLFGPYRAETNVVNGSTTNSSATYTNIELRLREASALMPHRLDLRLGIASALVGQAIQTNSPFDLRMRSALAAYQEVYLLDTNGFQAAIHCAAYSQAVGDTNAAESILARAAVVHPQRTQAYVQKFRRIEEILQMVPTEKPEITAELSRDRAIVILGAMLETNGTMKPKLVDRLQQGLKVAKLYPEAPIVVTGGNAKSGITEAYMMSLWLANQGIATNRIHLEDQARDTVGNAVRSCEILKKLRVSRATLVTSASHVQRALADFEEAALKRGLRLDFGHLAAKDEPVLDAARERVAIYRDVLRTSGLWAFPGMQQ